MSDILQSSILNEKIKTNGQKTLFKLGKSQMVRPQSSSIPPTLTMSKKGKTASKSYPEKRNFQKYKERKKLSKDGIKTNGSKRKISNKYKMISSTFDRIMFKCEVCDYICFRKSMIKG